jgi:hypothetical protein
VDFARVSAGIHSRAGVETLVIRKFIPARWWKRSSFVNSSPRQGQRANRPELKLRANASQTGLRRLGV